MSVEFQVDTRELDRLARRLSALSQIDQQDVLEGIGALVESQTKDRIRNEKTAPDGTPWEPWKDWYASTRHGGQSLLVGEGDRDDSAHLDSSIQYIVEGDEVSVGSNLPYAAMHQFGGTTSPKSWMPNKEIPARPYLGLSTDDRDGLADVMEGFLQDQLEELVR